MKYDISPQEQVRMLRKLLLYWDGQWFLKTAEEFGLETAIRMNARVRAAFGRIEMRTLLRAVGKSQADDLADALHLLDTYAQTFMGSTLRAHYELSGPNKLEVRVYNCAALAGAKMANLERIDQACVACETLWNAWFDTLLPGKPIDVQYPMRMGKGDPHCHFIITITVSP
ncbi:MAG: hypothetical protein H5T62_13480 [Anaerolineae bacterium]|nr:hypothetical protein [Anaerolineae bacterium]